MKIKKFTITFKQNDALERYEPFFTNDFKKQKKQLIEDTTSIDIMEKMKIAWFFEEKI